MTTNLWFNYNETDDCFYILMHSPDSERMPEDIVVSTTGETLWMSCQYADFQPFARLIFETVQKLQKVPNKSVLVVVENETADA